MLSLVNNLGSLVAQNNLNNANTALNTSLQRLSSGLRINSGADDPAGLVISQEEQAQMSGLSTAITNTSKATNVVQTADGALNETNTLLLQIRGLAVDAANSGANDPNTLAADQAQISNALDTITRIATSTQFGTDQLLDGTHDSAAGISSSVITGGTGTLSAAATAATTSGNYTATISSLATQATATGATFATGAATVLSAGQTETLTINGSQIQLNGGANGLDADGAVSAINQNTTQTGVTASITSGKLVLTSVAYGAATNKITLADSPVQGAGAGTGTGLGAASFTGGADVAGTLVDGSANPIQTSGVGNVLTGANGLSITTDPTATTLGAGTIGLVVTNNSLTFQIGANAGQTATLSIQNAQSSALGQGVSSVFENLSQLDVTNPANSADALKVIDKAINDVSSLRGTLGAFQNNTLQATANNLQASLQNTTAAESTITDTNFASETANYTQNQVLVQAGTQVLKNANQIPQLVLTLLQ